MMPAIHLEVLIDDEGAPALSTRRLPEKTGHTCPKKSDTISPLAPACSQHINLMASHIQL